MVILPSINRRHLMTATATIVVAGLAPNATPADGLANSAIALPTEPLVPPAVAHAGNFDAVTILRLREIAQRNRIRQEAGLPLLLAPKELRRMKEAADAEKFRKYADAHRKRVYAKTLARARRRSGDLNWTPTGMLSGGGMLFGAKVDRQLRKLYGRIGARPATTNARVRLHSSDNHVT
jgi:hypothetical protein